MRRMKENNISSSMWWVRENASTDSREKSQIERHKLDTKYEKAKIVII